MSVPGFSAAPSSLDSLTVWEQFLKQCVHMPLASDATPPPVWQSPVIVEQNYLKQILQFAKTILPKTAISEPANNLQRRALRLIKLRRRIVPDESMPQISQSLHHGVVILHQALEEILHQIEQLVRLYDQADLHCQQVTKVAGVILSGEPSSKKLISEVVQTIRSHAADASIDFEDWFLMCELVAPFRLKSSESKAIEALVNAMQTSFLAGRMVGARAPWLSSEICIAGCLLKDICYWQKEAEFSRLSNAHHSLWSTAMIAHVTGYGEALKDVVRHHHECLDQSGLPNGAGGVALREEDRLVALLARWWELSQAMPQRQIAAFRKQKDVTGILKQEVKSGRWDRGWFEVLETLLPGGIQTANEEPAVSDWKIPAPKFVGRSSSRQHSTAVRAVE